MRVRLFGGRVDGSLSIFVPHQHTVRIVVTEAYVVTHADKLVMSDLISVCLEVMHTAIRALICIHITIITKCSRGSIKCSLPQHISFISSLAFELKITYRQIVWLVLMLESLQGLIGV